MKPTLKKKLLIVVTALVIIFFVYGIVNIYWIGGENSLTISLARTFPLPLAKIEKLRVSLNQFYHELDSIKVQPESESFSDQQLRQHVWDKIKREYAIRALADQYELESTHEEVDQYFKDFFESETSSSHASILSQDYKTTEKDFKEHIIVPIVLQDKITEYLMRITDNDSLQFITSVYAKTQSDPTQFESELEAYGKKNSIQESDNTLLLLESDLVEELQFIKTLNPNEVGPVVAAADGYRLYKLIAHFTQPQEAWQVREFFVPARVYEDAIAGFESNMHVTVYAPSVIKKTSK